MDELIMAAKHARTKAYAPYSHFNVGAAVRGASGKIYTGSNIENASYGLTNCAERTAIFKAISDGERVLDTIALVADSKDPVAPCGACRQVMVEFGISTIIMANTSGKTHMVSMAELLPWGFEKTDLPGEDKNNE
ncbi:MAG: cytidine deaminase [Firmicutes bacterium]|nr:cytidine deaminase [Bacillota bacterium]